jgi:dTDP-N-acetylfucosamine:lipid II N-acetylfucosaminyltransferase
MNRNLHLMIDVDQSNWYVEKCCKYAPESEDTFINFSEDAKHMKHPRLTVVKSTPQEYDRIAEEINQGHYQQVIINYFDYPAAELVSRIHNSKTAIIWMIWGADLYMLPFFWNKIYDPFAMQWAGITRGSHYRKMFRLWKRRLRHGVKDHTFLYKAMRKVTHAATLVTYDVDLARKYLSKRIIQIPLSFSGIEDFIQAAPSVNAPKLATIQIGNSADPANNHVEMLRLLSKMEITNPIFIPTAYGAKSYSAVLQDEATKALPKDQVEFQLEYISKQTYFEQLSNTGFAIMGHIRQQAFANIVALLYFGAKVFLRERNPLLRLFRSWGVALYSVEYDLNKAALDTPLDVELRASNRKAIEAHLSEERMRGYYRNLMLESHMRNHEK